MGHLLPRLNRYRWILVACCASAVLAQGTDPKPKVEDYDAHTQARSAAIGGEFMIHSFSGRGQMYIVNDYLVVEVAIYPPKGQGLLVDYTAFQLRLNGKRPILPQPPSMVASSLQHPEWNYPRGVQAGGGLGNVGVILGGPKQSPTPYPTPEPTPPRVPRAPAPDNPSGIDREPPVPADQLLLQTALPEGKHQSAVSGFLYFPWKGKAGSLKTVELLFEDAVLKLR